MVRGQIYQFPVPLFQRSLLAVREYSRLSLVVSGLVGLALGAAVPLAFLLPLASQLRSAQLLLSEFGLLKAELKADMTGLAQTEVAKSCAEAIPLPVEAWRKE